MAVNVWNEFKDMEVVERLSGVKKSLLYETLASLRDHATLRAPPGEGGGTAAGAGYRCLGAEGLIVVRETVDNDATLNLRALREAVYSRCGKFASMTTLSRVLARLGYSRKKVRKSPLRPLNGREMNLHRTLRPS